MAWGDGANFALGGFNMAQAMAGQQGGHLAGMANQAMGVIGAENEKRAAIAREQRRMEHERQMMQMQIDAMLKRLEAEQRPRMSGPQSGTHFSHSPDRGWEVM